MSDTPITGERLSGLELGISIRDRRFPNPVGVASGTFGYGSEYESLIDLSRIGALYTKAVTPLPRLGNDMPRIIETPSGMLNSIGLANVGLERFITEKLPFLSGLTCPVVVNVAGSVEEDYQTVVERLAPYDAVWGFEINISCPNVKHGGIAFGTDPETVERLVRVLRGLTVKPLIVKLTPNVTDITIIARAAERGGADAVSCINTLVGMVIDIRKKRPMLAAGTGGLSGPAIRPVGVAMVYRTARAVSIPVIGIGGIVSWKDAVQYLLAGASAVQVGTGTFVDPETPVAVLEGILRYADSEGLASIEDFHRFLR
jgi:dihydroorotate dehydrogenase (NAD+) catalytic subunit